MKGSFTGLIQPRRSILFLLDDEGILYRMSNADKAYQDPIVSFRLRALSHYQKYGFKSTCDAFQIGKSTLYRFRKTYLSHNQKAVFLKKKSTKPKSFRQMKTDPEIVSFIRNLREEHYRLGKEKIKPLLDEYCLNHNLKPISISTIGKVIKRQHFFFQRSTRYRHNPNWKKPHYLKPKLRAKYSWTPQQLGHIQMDTVFKFRDGLKRYAISVMDIKSRFVLTLTYPNLTSTTALDALMKFQWVYPIPIKSLQTDNGLEFQGKFDQYLVKQHIPHYFTYPRCPKINAYIERYNRTMQEEFLDSNLDLLSNPQSFHDKLLEYLIFFNTKRVHKALGNRSPMDYLISEGYFSQMYATHTMSCRYKPICYNSIIMLRNLVELGRRFFRQPASEPIASVKETGGNFPEGWVTVESMGLSEGSLFKEKSGLHMYRVIKVDKFGGIEFVETTTDRIKIGTAGAQADWSGYIRIDQEECDQK